MDAKIKKATKSFVVTGNVKDFLKRVTFNLNVEILFEVEQRIGRFDDDDCDDDSDEGIIEYMKKIQIILAVVVTKYKLKQTKNSFFTKCMMLVFYQIFNLIFNLLREWDHKKYIVELVRTMSISKYLLLMIKIFVYQRSY